MTRKITREAVNAFNRGVRFKQSNTEIKIVDGHPAMYLFGNKIAWKNQQHLCFTMCGWNSVTTRERLSYLVGNISTKNGNVYWQGQEISPYNIYTI